MATDGSCRALLEAVLERAQEITTRGNTRSGAASAGS
jgi:hypothetical protein